MSSEKLRQHSRAELLWRAEITYQKNNYEALVYNISISGAKVYCPNLTKITSKNILSIVCQYSAGLPEILFDAEIMWLAQGYLGIRFLKLNNKTNIILQNFLKYHLGYSETLNS